MNLSLRGVESPTTCPPGSWCPSGTRFATEHLCPAGTFSNMTGLHNFTQCMPCSPGKFCNGEGRLV